MPFHRIDQVNFSNLKAGWFEKAEKFKIKTGCPWSYYEHVMPIVLDLWNKSEKEDQSQQLRTQTRAKPLINQS